MNVRSQHTFHIPVLGLAYSIDSPAKVARFGISSVISIVQDDLLEQMREFYSHKTGRAFQPIPKSDIQHREKRITAYLNLMQQVVWDQIEQIKSEPFEEDADIMRYFRMLPEDAPSKKEFLAMLEADGDTRIEMQNKLREKVIAGDINVNIMTKIDNVNYHPESKEPLPAEYSDAMSALRGFANSNLSSSVVFSAGLNPRLYGYLEHFKDFYPDENGLLKKRVILKVSDYRSALVQGKFLAKKGIWVSEFRIESGLNCGGHAFPTEGHLLGPILEEFRKQKQSMSKELFELCNSALIAKGLQPFHSEPLLQVTVQGGIGTAEEDLTLRNYYKMDATGWGSPFLLVPEATTLDDETVNKLANAEKEDYYLSHSSPLGVPFNNFRHSSSEEQRINRIQASRPGSPCYKKHLAFNREFTETPICEASRQYQNLKINELKSLNLEEEEYNQRFNEITEKDCLCEGLSAPALLKNEIPVPRNLTAVAVCPGPNLAYFSGKFSLEQMVGHIYGRKNILNALPRPHMFINELKMYVDHLKKETQKSANTITEKQARYFANFKSNLITGIDYYLNHVGTLLPKSKEMQLAMSVELNQAKALLQTLPS